MAVESSNPAASSWDVLTIAKWIGTVIVLPLAIYGAKKLIDRWWERPRLRVHVRDVDEVQLLFEIANGGDQPTALVPQAEYSALRVRTHMDPVVAAVLRLPDGGIAPKWTWFIPQRRHAGRARRQYIYPTTAPRDALRLEPHSGAVVFRFEGIRHGDDTTRFNVFPVLSFRLEGRRRPARVYLTRPGVGDRRVTRLMYYLWLWSWRLFGWPYPIVGPRDLPAFQASMKRRAS